jgi:hypothetical protein
LYFIFISLYILLIHFCFKIMLGCSVYLPGGYCVTHTWLAKFGRIYWWHLTKKMIWSCAYLKVDMKGVYGTISQYFFFDTLKVLIVWPFKNPANTKFFWCNFKSERKLTSKFVEFINLYPRQIQVITYTTTEDIRLFLYIYHGINSNTHCTW